MTKKIIILIIALMLIVISVVFLSKGFLRSYVNIDIAKQKAPQYVQVIANIDKKVKPFTIEKFTYFQVKDKAGNKMQVVYTGNLPQNFYHSDQTVLQGFFDKKANRFAAKHILLKCPSKYKEKAGK